MIISTLRKTVAAVMLLLPSCVFAQTYQDSFKGEPYSFELRDLYHNKSHKSDGNILRTMTRGSNTASTKEILWINRISNLPDCLRRFYYTYQTLLQEVLEGGSNCLSDPDNDRVNATVDDEGVVVLPVATLTRKVGFTYPVDVVENNPAALQQYAYNAFWQDYTEILSPEIDPFTEYMDFCMSYDMPQAFWIGYNTRYQNYFKYRYGFPCEPGRDTVEYAVNISMILKYADYDYDVRIKEFTPEEAVNAAVSEYNGIIDGILANVPNTSRYEQVRYLNNWLTTNNAYSAAYETGDFPMVCFSPISALRGTEGQEGPVCEGYSRAFKILCDKLGIPCILMAGDAYTYSGSPAEPHMWNEVMMNDNKWYAVDVTFNDPGIKSSGPEPKVSGVETEDYLLIGKNTVVSKWPEPLTFAQAYINNFVESYEVSSYWDYNSDSYVEDERFDPVTGVERVVPYQGDDVIYSILGVRVDRKPHELEPGLYIINGRKVVIR